MTDWLTNPAKLRQYLVLVGDALIVATSFAGGLLVRAALAGGAPKALAHPWQFLRLAGVTLVLQLLIFFIFNLYDLNVRFAHGKGLLTVAVAVLTATVTSAALFYFAGRFIVGRTVLLAYVPITVLGAFLWRTLFFNRLLRVTDRRKILLVGLDGSIETFLDDLDSFPVKEYQVVGVLCERAVDPEDYPGPLPVTPCSPDRLAAIVQENDVEVLVHSLTASLSDDFRDAMLDRRLEGLDVRDAPSFYGELIGKIPVDAVDSRWMLQAIGNDHRSPVAHNVLRVVEVVGSALIFLLTAPLFAIIALAIKIDSPGPVFFTQRRLGYRQQPIVVSKFRTMVQDAEAKTGPVWTSANDPRVTWVGNILRKTGFDELPQLINIFRGEMTYVGFRPIRKHFADMLAEEIPFYRLRFSIRPGVTGWPQVHHDYGASVEGQREKFEYELFYLKNRSLLLDAFIILKTVQKIVLRRFSRVEEEDTTEPEPAAEPDVPS